MKIFIFTFHHFIDATAVVQVEDTKLIKGTDDNTEEKEIEIMSEVKHGQDIRYFTFNNTAITK